MRESPVTDHDSELSAETISFSSFIYMQRRMLLIRQFTQTSTSITIENKKCKKKLGWLLYKTSSEIEWFSLKYEQNSYLSWLAFRQEAAVSWLTKAYSHNLRAKISNFRFSRNTTRIVNLSSISKCRIHGNSHAC